MEQPERRTARQHQRRTTEAELDLLKEFQLGGMRQFRQFHLADPLQRGCHFTRVIGDQLLGAHARARVKLRAADVADIPVQARSEEHTSERQSLMSSSYDVSCLNKNNISCM